MKVRLININNNALEEIYKAYRVCYSKYSYEDIKVPSMNDMVAFICDKIDRGHFSPLEHINVTFSIEGCSRVLQQQLTRHRTGKFSIQSQRYVNADNFNFVTPNIDYMPSDERNVSEEYFKQLYSLLKDAYDNLIKLGVEEEDARYILPLATTGQIIMTMDLRNLRNFLNQRLCKHAQTEIRELASAMIELIKPRIPFVDYKVLNCQKGLCTECYQNK